VRGTSPRFLLISNSNLEEFCSLVPLAVVSTYYIELFLDLLTLRLDPPGEPVLEMYLGELPTDLGLRIPLPMVLYGLIGEAGA